MTTTSITTIFTTTSTIIIIIIIICDLARCVERQQAAKKVTWGITLRFTCNQERSPVNNVERCSRTNSTRTDTWEYAQLQDSKKIHFLAWKWNDNARNRTATATQNISLKWQNLEKSLLSYSNTHFGFWFVGILINLDLLVLQYTFDLLVLNILLICWHYNI